MGCVNCMLKYDNRKLNIQGKLEKIVNGYNEYHCEKLLKLEIQDGKDINEYFYPEKIVYSMKFTGLGTVYLNNVELLSLIENQGFEKPSNDENASELEYDLYLDYWLNYDESFGGWCIRIYNGSDLKYYDGIVGDDWFLELKGFVTYYDYEINYFEQSVYCNVWLSGIDIHFKDDVLCFNNYIVSMGKRSSEYIEKVKLI